MTASGVTVCAALIDAGMVTPVIGLVSAAGAAVVCWWLGLALTGIHCWIGFTMSQGALR